MGLSSLVRLLPSLTLLARRGLMHSHGLRTRRCTRARGDHARALFNHFSFCCDVRHHTTPDFSKSLGVTSDERFVEWSRENSLPERIDYHRLISGVDPHHLFPKAINELFQRLPLILPHVEKIIRNGWGSTVCNVLFPEKLRKLCKRSHVAIWETD